MPEQTGWEAVWDRLTAEGWLLERERRFRMMFGAYWEVTAEHPAQGLRIVVEGPTLRIAVKKLASRIAARIGGATI